MFREYFPEIEHGYRLTVLTARKRFRLLLPAIRTPFSIHILSVFFLSSAHLYDLTSLVHFCSTPYEDTQTPNKQPTLFLLFYSLPSPDGNLTSIAKTSIVHTFPKFQYILKQYWKKGVWILGQKRSCVINFISIFYRFKVVSMFFILIGRRGN